MKYVIRTEKGDIFTNTEWGENNGKEITYETYEDAAKEKSVLQASFLDQKLKIIEINIKKLSTNERNKVN